MPRKKIKVVEANVKNSAVINRIEGFSRRFNITLDMANPIESFKNRCLIAMEKYIGNSDYYINAIHKDFCTTFGIQYEHDSWTMSFDSNKGFQKSAFRKILSKWDVKNDTSLFVLLLAVELVLNHDIEQGYDDDYNRVTRNRICR